MPPSASATRIETGTVFMNRCDYLDPALAWTGVKDTGRGCTLSRLGFDALTRPKSSICGHRRPLTREQRDDLSDRRSCAGNWNYPTSVRFGAGRIAELADACKALGIERPLLVTDPGLARPPMIARR